LDPALFPGPPEGQDRLPAGKAAGPGAIVMKQTAAGASPCNNPARPKNNPSLSPLREGRGWRGGSEKRTVPKGRRCLPGT